MKTEMNLARGGASTSKKLLAAIAVLAVAFAVFAAIPAVDAEDGATTGPVKIEDVSYPDLVRAFASVKEGETITLTESIEGSGIGIFVNEGAFKIATKFDENGKATEWKPVANKVTLDFAGNTYTLVAPAVGSNGYETQGFHIEKGYELTLKNGTIDISKKTSAVKMLFQNYAQLTLEKITLDGTNLADAYYYNEKKEIVPGANYTFNNNNSTIVMTDCKVIARSGAVNGDSHRAMGVYGNPSSSYNGVSVELHGQNDIGLIEIDGSKDATLTVKTGVLKADVLINDKRTFSVDAGASFDGTVAHGESSLKVKIEAGTGGVTFTSGSIEFFGAVAEESGNSITILSGEAKITDNYTIPAGMTLTVNAGAKLTVADNKTLTVSEDASLAVTGVAAGTITNSGTVITGTGANIADANITNSGNGQITNNADDSEMSEVTVGGISDAGKTVFTAKNIVIVNKSWTLIDGSDVTINGKLVIPEGATLTIQSGAKLTLDNNAVFEIEGTLVIEEAEEVAPTTTWGLIVKMGEVRISNNVTVNGPVDVQANGKLTIGQDGTLIIGTEGSLKTIAGSKVTVDASGTLQVNGQFDGATIYNKGTVIINTDKTAAGTTTIHNIADGAVVDVVKFTAKANTTASIVVDDNGLVFTTYRDSATKTDVQVTNNSKNNVITIAPSMSAENDKFNASVSGVKIVSVTSSKDAKENAIGDQTTGLAKGKQWTKSMDVSGSVAASYIAVEEGTVPQTTTKAQAGVTFGAETTTIDGKIVVSGDLALADNISMTNYVKDFTVTGTISAVESETIINSGKITVSGEGEISNVEGTVANTVSTLYVTSVKDAAGTEVKTNHYVNIDKALAVINAEGSAVKEITLQDNQTVKASSKVPADKTLNLNGKKLTIDAKDNVTLTVVSGAVVKGATGSSIDVDGTLFAENKNNVKSGITIDSDVYSEEVDEKGNAVKNGWAKWTNLTTALNEAKPGQKIVLKDEVTLTTNTTVPEGVTLEAGDKDIKLADGVTLTVDGILTTNADILAQSAFATTAQKVTVGDDQKYSSAVVVNGKLISSAKITYAYTEASPVSKTSTTGAYTAKLTEKSVVAGAYYEQDSNYVISSLKVAQAEFSTIQSKIVINGAVTAGDLAFTATEDCSEIEVAAAVNNGLSGDNPKTIDTVLTVSSMTLSGMTLTVNGKITGTVAVGDAAIDAKLVSGIVVESDESKLTVSGTTASPTIALGKGASLTVSKGTVYAANVTINNNSDKTYVSVASGATLEIAGTVSVDYIAVAGILNVPSGKEMTVDAQIDVTGAVTVAPATDSTLAGKLIVDGVLYLGISSNDLETGAAASFSGPVTVNSGKKLVVAADASVDDAFKASVKDCKSTEFYVNGALWFTAYANGTATITVDKIPVADVKLDGWSKTDGGKAVDTTTDFTYTIGSSAKLYAVIVTEVYDIVIKADEGIANVYLDGQLMTYGSVAVLNGDNAATAYYYAYTATVAAGDHKVTYTLQNGWSGEATLYLNGTAVSGNTIKASGDFSKDLVFTLSGVQKSGYVDPTPAPSTDDNDDGLTITDYLLIVLVVLIVILAVIVAMRLMRS
mgnify:CR=1 FL=1